MRSLSDKTPNEVISSINDYGGVKDNEVSITSRSERRALRKSQNFGLFNNLVNKTALEAVIPYMDRWDAEIMLEMYDKYLKEKDPTLYDKVAKGSVAKIPENMIRDCFQNHMRVGEEVKFNLNDFNKNSYEFVKNINDDYMQVITNHSMRNSFITTREIIYQLQKALETVDPNDASGGEGQDSNEGKDNIAGVCNNFLNSKKGAQKMDQAKQQAMETIQQMDNSSEMTEALDKDEQDSGDSDSGGKQAGKGEGFSDVKKEFEMMKMLNKISLDSKMLGEMLKDSLSSTVSYFTASYKEFRESIFESNDINEVLGVENVLDELFLTCMEDIETVYRKYKLRINVYIDISGSMTTSYQLEKGKSSINCLDICKLLAVKMKAKGLLNDVYVFNDDVSKRRNLKHLLNTHTSGGTNIDRTIQHVIDQNIPSLILTDAQDTIHLHTDKVYFLTLGGATPSASKEIRALYRENKQGISYNMDNTFSRLEF